MSDLLQLNVKLRRKNGGSYDDLRQQYQNSQTHVYSFPILNNGEYVGAIAALRPLDEFELEASSFGLSREDAAQWNNVHLIDFSASPLPLRQSRARVV